MFSNYFQTMRPQTVIELVTKARATWEDAVYPRPSRWISQVAREYELVAPRDLGCWGATCRCLPNTHARVLVG
jgi:hypothetical protein